MKKIIITSVIIAIIIAICGVLSYLKWAEVQSIPDLPEQTKEIEQIEHKSPVVTEPKTNPEEPQLLDENDVPKSNVNVPEIG